MDFEIPDSTSFLGVEESQPTPPKKSYRYSPLVALKTCNVEFDSCIVELVAGCEVHGLKRQEREYLKFHKFAEWAELTDEGREK